MRVSVLHHSFSARDIELVTGFVLFYFLLGYTTLNKIHPQNRVTPAMERSGVKLKQSWWNQFKVMLWKGFLLKWRTKKAAAWEIIMPLYFVGILAVVRLTSKKDALPQFGPFPNYTAFESQFMYSWANQNRLLVSPNTTDVQTLMTGVTSILGSYSNATLKVEYYSDQNAAENEFRKNNSDILAGIIFSYANGSKLSYALRMGDEAVPGTKTDAYYAQQSACRQDQGGTQSNDEGLMYAYNCDVNRYLFNAFTQLQTAIDTALIRDQLNLPAFSVPGIHVEMLPKPAYLADSSYIQIISSMYFVMAYSPFISMLMAYIVTEKEKKIKEGMKMMGLRNSVYWCSWTVLYAVIFAAITGLVTIIASLAKFFVNSNMFLFFLLQFLYGLSIIAMAFMLTPFFKKAKTAAGLSGLFTILASTLYLVVSLTRTYAEGTGSVSYKVPVYGRWLLCLISPVALSLGIDQAMYLDYRDGMSFATASHGEFPLYGPMVMLLVDTIVYFTLAVYFDCVIPGEYGPKYKPGFFLKKSFWFPKKRDQRRSVTYSNDAFVTIQTNNDSHEDDIEAVPQSMKSKASVVINNLCKTFPNKEKGKKNEPIKAVNGLSLTMYEDQITAILGHNGAGKTTTLNILTGLASATSGSATILGYDCSDPQDIETLRSMTGVCPQHNILFDQLNCVEHLKLFAGLKGVLPEIIDKEIHDALESVDLLDQKDVIVEHLSGGQKRKLSVAISVIGDPKLIFLDEPTAGMDPYSRRHLWQVLKEKKKGRIILLTTHFMDEADILADRKAIISKGQLRCCGSSLFLKNRFGLGYHLNMVVDPTCEPDKVNNFVSRIVEGSQMNRLHGKELDMMLPHDQVSKFAELFSNLENKAASESLGIKNFGVSMTTLEEVFLKLEEESEIDLQEFNGDLNNADNASLLPKNMNKYGSDDDVKATNPSDSVVCVEGWTLFWQRFRALVWIRLLAFKRNGTSMFMQLMLPVITLTVGLILGKVLNNNAPSSSQADSLLMQPSMYTKLASGAGQYFPYSTVPRLLLRDQVNSSLSQTMAGNISATYTTNTYSNIYYDDKFRLLDKDISPHYLGVELNSLSQNAQGLTTSYKVMYNDSAVHSIPATINMMSNSLMIGAQYAFSGVADLTKLIQTYSLPWPELEPKKVFNTASFTSVLLIGIGFSFIPASFAVDIVKDRQLKIRSQLRVSGLPFFQYYLACFVTDMAKNFIPAIITIILALAIQIDGLTSGGAVLSFILVCIFYVPANILFTYCISFIFDKYETCQSSLPTVYLMVGYVPYIPVSILDMMGEADIAKYIHYAITVLIPPYNIFGGLYYITRVTTVAIFTGTTDQIKFSDYFEFSSGIPIVYLMSIVHVFLFFFLLRVLDIKKSGGDVREACLPGKGSNSVIPVVNNDINEKEDEDITAEREFVKNMRTNNMSKPPVAIAENLRKEFVKDNKKPCTRGNTEDSVKVAVRNQTFAVRTGEVFGLLGPNGAGKTTTLNMMIADMSPTKGRVTVGGYDINSSMSGAFQAMGYCPQHDALWEDITLKEHLDCYSKCRGIPADQAEEVTNFFISNLKLDEHKGKLGKALSGGTKRKLSYCMSMLGRPKIVLLDEPSTGMDPQSKRFLWDTISQSFENSDERGAILTTHYMEEADALCSKIAIMVNGRMECIGSSQHLKSKYGSGYMLELKLNVDTENTQLLESKTEAVNSYIRTLFPSAVVMEKFAERIQYKIPRSNVTSLSRTFTMLEEGKAKYDIVEYSFSQSTLEQVFLEFAKKQLDDGQTVEEQERERVRSFKRSLSLNADEPSLIENSENSATNDTSSPQVAYL